MYVSTVNRLLFAVMYTICSAPLQEQKYSNLNKLWIEAQIKKKIIPFLLHSQFIMHQTNDLSKHLLNQFTGVGKKNKKKTLKFLFCKPFRVVHIFMQNCDTKTIAWKRVNSYQWIFSFFVSDSCTHKRKKLLLWSGIFTWNILHVYSIKSVHMRCLSLYLNL